MEAIARLNNLRISPRKMRLVANSVRGMEVVKALHTLKHEAKRAATPLRKLLLSAISNWDQHYAEKQTEEQKLFVNKILVDVGKTMKRFKPAPQGRAHRIRKRSNHVTIVVGPSLASTAVEGDNQGDKSKTK